ncbi:MAG: hypothetical protein A2277_06025 [Desulfobacterales bacterium RIFOXYA12_FULL_46_15]|nr:MAG: hypothetical protein A2277_06025 [Desulfobacterales bacterium RIFOXYA12_FULL_46_15]
MNEKPDLLVIAGDIFNYKISQNMVDTLRDLNLLILGVRGNSDLKWFEKKSSIRHLSHSCQASRSKEADSPFWVLTAPCCCSLHPGSAFLNLGGSLP